MRCSRMSASFEDATGLPFTRITMSSFCRRPTETVADLPATGANAIRVDKMQPRIVTGHCDVAEMQVGMPDARRMQPRKRARRGDDAGSVVGVEWTQVGKPVEEQRMTGAIGRCSHAEQPRRGDASCREQAAAGRLSACMAARAPPQEQLQQHGSCTDPRLRNQAPARQQTQHLIAFDLEQARVRHIPHRPRTGFPISRTRQFDAKRCGYRPPCRPEIRRGQARNTSQRVGARHGGSSPLTMPLRRPLR